MNNFKRTGLDTESYVKNRENQFKLMTNDPNGIRKIIRKDFLDLAGNNDLLTRGRDSIGLQNDIAIGSGRNVQSLNPLIYQKIFNDVIKNQSINNDAKKKIVEEIYRINDNLTINNQVYDNLKSSENSVSFSEISPQLLDTSFEYNLNYLNEFSKQIRTAARNGELNNNQSSINIISNAIQSSSDKAASNSKISKSAQELWDINKNIQNEFDIQNAAHRSKNKILSNDPDLKQNLKNIRKYDQEIGNLKTLDDKFSKLPERLDQINERLNNISQEKNRLTDMKNELDITNTKDRGYKKATQSYENDLKNLDKETKGLIKELKGMSELALDKKPSRAENEKKSIFRENVGSKIEKDINYAKRLVENIKKPDTNGKNALENKIEKFKDSNNQMINDKGAKKAITSINRVRESIQGKLKENAELYKKRDELKANLNKKISVGGAYKETQQKGSSQAGKINQEIKVIDQAIKTNNKSIKDSMGSIKKMETTELKNKTKEIKDLNKSNSNSLKFQEKNPLKQKGNPAKTFLKGIEKKLTSFTSRIEERLSRGSNLSSKEALADGKYLSNLTNAAKKAVGTASGLAAVGAEKTAEATKTAAKGVVEGVKVVGKGAVKGAETVGRGVVEGAKVVGKGALFAASLPVAAGEAIVKGTKAAAQGISNTVSNAVINAENAVTDFKVATAKALVGKHAEVIKKESNQEKVNTNNQTKANTEVNKSRLQSASTEKNQNQSQRNEQSRDANKETTQRTSTNTTKGPNQNESQRPTSSRAAPKPLTTQKSNSKTHSTENTTQNNSKEELNPFNNREINQLLKDHPEMKSVVDNLYPAIKEKVSNFADKETQNRESYKKEVKTIGRF